jgi:hypothetical protein
MSEPKSITATIFARSVSEILNQVYYRGERFVVQRGGKYIAKIEPVDSTKTVTLTELVERLRGVELPGDGFADDLERIQSEQSEESADHWPS